MLVRLLRPFLSFLPYIRDYKKSPELPDLLYVIIPGLWVLFLFLFSVYDGKKNLRVVDEFYAITVASLIAFLTTSGLLFYAFRDISRFLVFLYFAFNFGVLLLWRLVARGLYNARIQEKGYQTRVLIIGAGPVGTDIYRKLQSLQNDSILLAGFLDDAQDKVASLPAVIGSIDQIRPVVREGLINQILVTLPNYATERIQFVIDQTRDLPVEINLVPDFFHLTINQMTLTSFQGIPLLGLRTSSLDDYQRFLKRIFDVLFCSIALVAALPVMALVSLLILLFDGRPVVFKQQRVGENGKIFHMYKFRTMRKDAEKEFFSLQQENENGSVIYKTRDDPRVTGLGRLLRRFSLDELPQFFQIIRGTMSLVGPRPEIPAIVARYQPWQRARLSVPQGLTGWWQVNGRSDRPLHLHIEDDLYYINNYSIWLDIIIVIKTVWIIIRGKGAY
jgi:exopolysaccharide biosynthesis polyprenyl glycosylphosphotransferase